MSIIANRYTQVLEALGSLKRKDLNQVAKSAGVTLKSLDLIITGKTKSPRTELAASLERALDLPELPSTADDSPDAVIGDKGSENTTADAEAA